MPRVAFVVEDLDRAACERLIETIPMGRIGSLDKGLPKIVPAHCALHGGEIVIGTISAHNSVRVRHGDVVAFEADSYDPATCEGWCVGVIGPCRVITDEVEIRELDSLGFTPWTAEDGGHYVALPLGLLYGRALTSRRE
jgi:hypothetical protein